MLTRGMKDVLQVLALPRYPDSRGLEVMVSSCIQQCVFLENGEREHNLSVRFMSNNGSMCGRKGVGEELCVQVKHSALRICSVVDPH